MMKHLAIILLLVSTVLGQQRVRPIDLTPETLTLIADSAQAAISRNPGFTLDANSKAVVSSSFLADSLVAADTTALKLRKGASDGAMIYLAGLSATNVNGGGWFVYGDSAYAEGAVAFGAGVQGKQWVHYEYLQYDYVYVDWFGPAGDGATDDSAKLCNAFSAANNKVLFFSPDTFAFSQFNVIDIDNMQVLGNNATIICLNPSASDGYIAITSNSLWDKGWGSDFTAFGTTMQYDTIFAGDFYPDTAYVAIADSNDWGNISDGDLLKIGDTMEPWRSGSYQDHGTVLVFWKFAVRGGRQVMWFRRPPLTFIESDSIYSIAHQRIGGKSIKISDMNFINADLRVCDFEKITILNCNFSGNKDTDYPVEGLGISNYVNATVDNISSRGFLRTGGGYGLNIGHGDVFSVSNSTFSECRHGITTTAQVNGDYPTQNYIYIDNCKYIGSRNSSKLSSNVAYDTHSGAYLVKITDSDAIYASSFTNLRSDQVIIDGCTHIAATDTAGGTTAFINIPPETAVKRKKYVEIKNTNIENVANLALITGDIAKLKLDNVKYTMNKNSSYASVLYLYNNSTAGNIDTLIVSDCEFRGKSPSTGRFIYSLYSSSDGVIANSRFSNSVFDSLLFGYLYNRSKLAGDVIFNDCRFLNQNYLIQTTGYDTSSTMTGLYFNDCYFYNVPMLIYSGQSPYSYITHPVVYDNCHWGWDSMIFSGNNRAHYSDIVYRNIYIDLSQYSTNAPFYFESAMANKPTNITIDNCTVNDFGNNANNKQLFQITSTQSFSIMIKNSDISLTSATGTTPSLTYLRGNELSLYNNAIVFDSSTYFIRSLAAGVLIMHGNHINMSNETRGYIYNSAVADSTFFSNNVLHATGAANNTLIKQTSGYISTGGNQSYGTTTPIDTSGVTSNAYTDY